eukprot:CAMPEP_0197319282 /NCGR_PEP_ID=MMETSP0891-20130614/54107_1 /TAXON_ID=44058 ORGANISM="Aureoumbra lagunensis, Strain CCMP1510" /NCGR_SAMPLE_ID=MMETSP0891 /ASSEMBLY_ACC=CAM_ASM_000534 /LENGTH=828 /DNA_ID=CAMNT_0042810137 /DNA_START=30 /DNA_END=2517 /DNA_ORIENTATION=+
MANDDVINEELLDAIRKEIHPNIDSIPNPIGRIPTHSLFTLQPSTSNIQKKFRGTPEMCRINDMWKKGQMEFLLGKKRDAIILCGEAVLNDEKACDVNYPMSSVLIEIKNYCESVMQNEISQRALNNQGHVEVLIVLVYLSVFDYDLETKLKYIQMAADLKPNDMNIKKQLAAYLSLTQRFAQSLNVLREMRRCDPSNRHVCRNIAMLLWNAATKDQASIVSPGNTKLIEAIELMREYVGEKGKNAIEDTLVSNFDPNRTIIVQALYELAFYTDSYAFAIKIPKNFDAYSLVQRAIALEASFDQYELAQTAEARSICTTLLAATKYAQKTNCPNYYENPQDKAKNAQFKIGDRVLVHDLKSQKGKALEGKLGVITAIPTRTEASGRFQIRIAGKTYALHAQNLKIDNAIIQNDIDKTNLECCICLEKMDKSERVELTVCGHSFCAQCLLGMATVTEMKQMLHCPLCRTTIDPFDAQEIIKKLQKGNQDAKFDKLDVHRREVAIEIEQTQKKLGRPLTMNEYVKVTTNSFQKRMKKMKSTLFDPNISEHLLYGKCDDLSDDPVIYRSCDIEKNKMDIYGDGDQSNYTREPGSPGDDLCIHWANGGNFNPYQRPSSYTSFFKACSWGDYAEVEAILQETKNNSERNLFELLEYRESSLRKNPLSACIAGSRILEKFGSNSWPFSENNIHYFIDDFGIPQAIFIDAGSIASIGHITPQEISQKIQSYRKRIDFIKVAKLLLDHDCRVDSKDIIGVCPVGAAAGSHATKLSLEIATLIVQKGGDLALKPLTRNGECILTAPLISNRVDVCAHLLALGADPHASFAMTILDQT